MSTNNPSFKKPPIIIRGATSDVSSLKSDATNPPKLTPVSGQLLLEDSSLIKPMPTKIVQNCDTWEVGLTFDNNSVSEEILKFCGKGEEESSFDVREIQDKTKQIIFGYNTGKLPYVKPKGRSGSNQFDSSSFSDSQYCTLPPASTASHLSSSTCQPSTPRAHLLITKQTSHTSSDSGKADLKIKKSKINRKKSFLSASKWKQHLREASRWVISKQKKPERPKVEISNPSLIQANIPTININPTPESSFKRSISSSNLSNFSVDPPSFTKPLCQRRRWSKMIPQNSIESAQTLPKEFQFQKTSSINREPRMRSASHLPLSNSQSHTFGTKKMVSVSTNNATLKDQYRKEDLRNSSVVLLQHRLQDAERQLAKRSCEVVKLRSSIHDLNKKIFLEKEDNPVKFYKSQIKLLQKRIDLERKEHNFEKSQWQVEKKNVISYQQMLQNQYSQLLQEYSNGGYGLKSKLTSSVYKPRFTQSQLF